MEIYRFCRTSGIHKSIRTKGFKGTVSLRLMSAQLLSVSSAIFLGNLRHFALGRCSRTIETVGTKPATDLVPMTAALRRWPYKKTGGIPSPSTFLLPPLQALRPHSLGFTPLLSFLLFLLFLSLGVASLCDGPLHFLLFSCDTGGRLFYTFFSTVQRANPAAPGEFWYFPFKRIRRTIHP